MTVHYDGLPVESIEPVKPAQTCDREYGGYYRIEFVGGGTAGAFGDELHILPA
ncbi:hypothetical protein ABH922_003048 [Rhodococcus sp. 27YEA15]|uniref:hypothetical protein n=1 Tax=Rhodococcus sp. 27YEA15 TaxID=3156259 RepID=UPI003C7B54AB